MYLVYWFEIIICIIVLLLGYLARWDRDSLLFIIWFWGFIALIGSSMIFGELMIFFALLYIFGIPLTSNIIGLFKDIKQDKIKNIEKR